MHESIENLTEQEVQIVKLILNTGTVHYSDISKSIGRSRKTITKYLDNIAETVVTYKINLIRKRNVGIYFEGDTTDLQNAIQNKVYPDTPNTKNERVIAILSKLLLSNYPQTIQDLADSTFVSRSTLESDFKEVKRTLAKYDALIETTHEGMQVIASESAKRKLMSELLTMYWGDTMYLENKKGEVHRELKIPTDMRSFFSKDTFQKVLSSLDRFEQVSALHFTDYEFQSLAIHLIISMERIIKDKTLEKSDHPVKLEMNTISLIKILEAAFKVTIPQYERQYINIHILAAEGQPIGKDNLEKAASPIQQNTIHQFLEDNIRNHDEMLLRGLTVHVTSALKRLYLGLNLHNPYTADIKKFFPLAFNNAIDISAKIEKQFNITLNEDEVAFIALHIEAYIERQKSMVNAVIVCSTGLGTARLLEQRVKKFFADSIQVNRVTSIQELKNHPIVEDLVISTIRIEVPNAPVVVVPPFLDTGSAKQIRGVADEILTNRQNSGSFSRLLDKRLMFFANTQETRAMVIKRIGLQLEKFYFGRKGIVDAAIEREKLASTAIDNIAMPHAPIEFVAKPCIAVYINSYGIEWNGNSVNVVFFLAMNREVQTQIEQIYKYFNDVLENKKLLKELEGCTTAQEVLSKLGGDLIE
ncbi:BglG family transcription antiterminator [Pediococcus ethanolidurans]|uniref:LicABCH operon regulator n=1 Tax=Pediococcus ethanolidurans TaxID=319653 RepID=A0A0R2KBB0_9LACO|nr:BglG family transcription antiterminator [Pediococcus ethanolidurans]KRN83549.1 licABCH operon regulator [Pediococcus ethanolidurans]GEN94096.1 PTS sugar transporter [Pediococcus ethanolidurans]SER04986.1 Transcriptional antiterminator [Pediococcus ethanolidurans]